MTSLEKLKAAKSRDEVAALLGFKPSRLKYLLYVLPASKKYVEFGIPKRNGGTRKIQAPDIRLKLLQRRLANLLYLCLSEIDKNGHPRRPLAHGFARSLSIVTNAAVHRRRKYVLNLDLEDFFPSINFGRVRGMLMKDKRFELDQNVATAIAQIACHNGALPQGSPCSPVISNIVAHLLDVRMVRLARQVKCTYSRYADDITFSTNRGEFPPELALISQGTTWQLGQVLIDEIAKAGFAINHSKTRMQVRGSRQVATGLLVNEKVNIRPEYYRTVRSMCASLFASGTYYQKVPAALGGGKPGDQDIVEEVTSLAPLQGRLEHIYHVRDSVDRRESAEKKKKSTATRRLYHRFLFFKNFVALDKPVILPEGKTDSIYLRTAIQSLLPSYPKLGAITNGKLELSVHFMNYTKTVHDVLQLGNGTGDFKFFMLDYQERVESFKHRPLKHPVILLIDNDDGAHQIFSVAGELGLKGITHAATADFYRLTHNLYLVKTPETKSKTCIEDLFDPSLLAVEVGGKKFDPSKKHNEAGKYGKVVFAEQVVRPGSATIDFKGFGPLLERIVSVVDDYAKSPCT